LHLKHHHQDIPLNQERRAKVENIANANTDAKANIVHVLVIVTGMVIGIVRQDVLHPVDPEARIDTAINKEGE
jgi:hypothetical protein